ncbi:hypothetical protein [Kumtagia ephedrae]|uniref:hypothetical protein n=1 Tax=Kumtagia ephedrae TaxID=2116701 RepID=UPI001056FA9C|nr:hypothetical protein [Mesorhizobium ephedrae]
MTIAASFGNAADQAPAAAPAAMKTMPSRRPGFSWSRGLGWCARTSLRRRIRRLPSKSRQTCYSRLSISGAKKLSHGQ